MSKIAIALGGNALGNDPTSEKQNVIVPAQVITSLIKDGHDIVVGHGNGPQVGIIYNSFNRASAIDKTIPSMPFAECGGMSQGYIGYHIQTALANELKKAKINKDVVCLVTQTIVDINDKAFKNPTKPVGIFYKTMEEAVKLSEPGSVIKEIPNKGFRRVVPSPKPQTFLSIDTIKQMFDQGKVVIVGGGGGIPTIIDNNGNYVGVDGVIDKDYVMSKIAQLVEADVLVILTNVANACINYGKPNQQDLHNVTIDQLNGYIAEGQFASGSMLPKIEAAMEFAKSKPGRKAIIARLEDLELAIKGTAGTQIQK